MATTLIQCGSSQGKTRKVYLKIKKIRRKFQPRVGMLKDANGNKLTEPEQIKKRWKEYTEHLYKNDSVIWEEMETGNDREPNILKDEVIAAITLLSNNKAPGCDNIPLELIKSSEAAIDVITCLCQQIWTTGKWPKDWTRSVFIPIPKKGDVTDCGNYRTIALILHASKILLKILQRRLQPYFDRELPEEQAGFRRGRGTRDVIANIRWIMEKAKEYNKEIYFCFIDYSKAFDCVDHQKLWITMKDMGGPSHLISLIRNLYTDQEATV
ncbi:uncharacterized protein LOC134321608 [Trichomycterus rosablanca]|uniref:uncharacterized protein LOC134321608 n=1 Tax=Trichomycterus rosablanca TaxID=2290929 RepID=UPI002F35800B